MTNTEKVLLKNLVTDRDHVAGANSAPVTLVEYGNFQCIYCGQAFPIIKEVQKLLGENLRFVFRHFPTVRTHPRSFRAAEASEIAGSQNKFWEMHDEMFTHQQALEDQDLVRYAKRVGLDSEEFERNLAEGSFRKIVETEYNRSLFDEHITGTPTFYVNGARYTGASDLESLLDAIRQADSGGQIQIPDGAGRIRKALDRLRHRARS